MSIQQNPLHCATFSRKGEICNLLLVWIRCDGLQRGSDGQEKEERKQKPPETCGVILQSCMQYMQVPCVCNRLPTATTCWRQTNTVCNTTIYIYEHMIRMSIHIQYMLILCMKTYIVSLQPIATRRFVSTVHVFFMLALPLVRSAGVELPLLLLVDVVIWVLIKIKVAEAATIADQPRINRDPNGVNRGRLLSYATLLFCAKNRRNMCYISQYLETWHEPGPTQAGLTIAAQSRINRGFCRHVFEN